MPGEDRYRVVGTFPESKNQEEGEVLYEEIEREIKEQAKLKLELSDVRWFSLYKVHSRRVNKFSEGRCFLAGDSALWVYPLAILLVFLVLAALYESLALPLAIILIVPMGLAAALTGVWLTHGDNNIFTQIGFMVLVGLSAKNAILIVEFARELELAGRTPVQAAIETARQRLRPILKTSIAFVMGVLPLALSSGAGAEMRQAMGVAVFAGMIGVTAFGIFLTPVFYVLLRALSGFRPLRHHGGAGSFDLKPLPMKEAE